MMNFAQSGQHPSVEPEGDGVGAERGLAGLGGYSFNFFLQKGPVP